MPNKLTKEEFIKKANDKHGTRYDYSNVVYVNSSIKVSILCKRCGVFDQRPSSHLRGNGCPKCHTHNLRKLRRKTKSQFISDANVVHDGLYLYDNVEYINSRVKVCITCKKCGDFKQTPHSHLSGKGCPICRNSKGERMIRKILNDNDIAYVQQKTFEDCKYIQNLPYDFYIKSKNILIEFDGRHHYEAVEAFGGEDEFRKVIARDLIKDNYANDNEILLIRIPYTEYENIKDILSLYLDIRV